MKEPCVSLKNIPIHHNDRFLKAHPGLAFHPHNNAYEPYFLPAQSARVVEYTDYFSAEG